MPLDRRQITEAALDLLDEVGLGELSTRRLAARLGVSSPTLYWHVKDKAQLLDLLAEAVCEDAFEIDETRDWRGQLEQGLHQFRAILLKHRDAATLLRQRPPLGPNRLAHIESTARILKDAGFTNEDTAGIARLLTAHVLASVDEPPNAEAAKAVREKLEGYPAARELALTTLTADDLFVLGTEVILDGLAQRRK
ncbi:TetR/AcrR family transcriptional regulator C-terminal domain-containing protein [Amycolatopsis sp. OK19-0408]|uniref:TetR/AcrR family transcriptional regulator C-terminal domain-containing protein n=1 Tax=Amycolatopsis iheyensis TaxID=2945988 RepID=A0A9X2SJL9_9PSEU|nr:TetR/AcrR family transcriptional regulator C-terminal domain-containing protein [Amycolatopsis iheyensis]MCR6484178.1 TetR/AcrR family transcriptional regulator C-terminal domain-containing protein [Amycolatopsis iheyensis]